jgi:hypothetical protein
VPSPHIPDGVPDSGSPGQLDRLGALGQEGQALLHLGSGQPQYGQFSRPKPVMRCSLSAVGLADCRDIRDSIQGLEIIT